MNASTHPGEVIKDNMAALGMTQKRLAEIIPIPAGHAERNTERQAPSIGGGCFARRGRDGDGRRNPCQPAKQIQSVAGPQRQKGE